MFVNITDNKEELDPLPSIGSNLTKILPGIGKLEKLVLDLIKKTKKNKEECQNNRELKESYLESLVSLEELESDFLVVNNNKNNGILKYFSEIISMNNPVKISKEYTNSRKKNIKIQNFEKKRDWDNINAYFTTQTDAQEKIVNGTNEDDNENILQYVATNEVGDINWDTVTTWMYRSASKHLYDAYKQTLNSTKMVYKSIRYIMTDIYMVASPGMGLARG